MYIVICYDIVDDKLRYKVAKELKNFGIRVQKSVFEADISEKKFLELRYRLEKIIDPAEDSLRYYFLCARCKEQIENFGIGPLLDDGDLDLVF